MNNNSIAVNYNGKDTTIMVPLSGSTHVRALFGHAPEYLADVAPVNIKDVKVSQDGEQTCEWKLWKHNNNICFDKVRNLFSLFKRTTHEVILYFNCN